MHMRLHIHLSDELVGAIDELAGERGRSAFIRSALETEVEKQRRLASFKSALGAAPDFARHLPENWVDEGRRAWDERSAEGLREAAARHERPD